MDYDRIIFNIKLQLHKESDKLANLCNAMAFIMENLFWDRFKERLRATG